MLKKNILGLSSQNRGGLFTKIKGDYIRTQQNHSLCSRDPEASGRAKLLLMGQKPLIGMSKPLFQRILMLPTQGMEPGDIQ